MWLKVGENVVQVSYVSYGSKLFAYGTIVVLGSLRVNIAVPTKNW